MELIYWADIMFCFYGLPDESRLSFNKQQANISDSAICVVDFAELLLLQLKPHFLRDRWIFQAQPIC